MLCDSVEMHIFIKLEKENKKIMSISILLIKRDPSLPNPGNLAPLSLQTFNPHESFEWRQEGKWQDLCREGHLGLAEFHSMEGPRPEKCLGPIMLG